MTPEERERFMERMRARGFTPPAEAEAPASAPQRGRGQGAAHGSGRVEVPRALRHRPRPEPRRSTRSSRRCRRPKSFGQVWLNADGKLQRVRLRLGITDGQQTELIQAIDGTFQEGTEVVTNVITGAVRQSRHATGRRLRSRAWAAGARAVASAAAAATGAVAEVQ